MLFTRCPECDTTFRVTDETLKKANGQVRCGRCANVFNAYAELHDPGANGLPPRPSPPTDVTAGREPDSRPSSAPPSVPSETERPAAIERDSADSPPEKDDGERDVSHGEASLGDIIAQANAAAEAAAEPAETARGEAAPISATEIERVLSADGAPTLPDGPFAWSHSAETQSRRSRSIWWGVAAAAALVTLAAQAVHHFRSDIANDPTFGEWITSSYAKLGIEITPKWDVRQYQILDWVATAEPNSRGLGSLKIAARIQNRGPNRQPYPAVRLRLKDRWETAVRSRLFSPAEYLPRETPRGRLMSPGETARAEIEVVDPGPDAYGFELDVCIEVEASLVTCGTDEVFL